MSAASPHRSDAATPDGRGRRIGVVAARFNAGVCDRLLAGARRALRAAGTADADVVEVRVPGAVELPLAAQRLLDASGGRCDAVVALGCVIRGETSHYDVVCRMAADGLMRASLDARRPVAFGVLTCDHESQAWARAGDGPDNKGYEAALVALEMLAVADGLSR
ncbi:MAG TPA: 6,7-dimethyl-8-ribityllumazine synthase [Planctomycetota bacterium]|nr:6,7-dimethyl-8-ribityllumazine synthase [Planctomycetota bacterium]